MDEQLSSLYLNNYASLYRYAFTLVNDKVIAEEMLHEVFIKLIDKQLDQIIHTSVRAYLYRAVHNESMNYLKRLQVKRRYEDHSIARSANGPGDPYQVLHFRELQQRLAEAINGLPEQCRTVFQLSRYDELRYAEIAEQLNISVKTVENQIGKALKKLRQQLADYLPLIIAFLIRII